MRELLLLLFTHYLGDFGLQSDFLANFKRPGSQLNGESVWAHVMLAHCSIQALGVLLVTQRWEFAIVELVVHFAIDVAKCKGKLTFMQDQLLHALCRVVYWSFL